MTIKKHITKDEINQLPVGKFEGEIIIVNSQNAIKSAIKEIRKHRVVGFDTEAKPSFHKGVTHPVALIQIALPEMVFLFEVHKTGLHEELIQLFADRDIIKTGIAIHDDIKGLQKLKKFQPASFLELSEVTKSLDIVNSGARGLAAIFLDIRISKTQQTSNWENDILTSRQINYAATDAWLCLAIYQKICELGLIEPAS